MLKAVFDKILVKKTDVKAETVLYMVENTQKFVTGTVVSIGDKVECTALKEGSKIIFKKGLQLETIDSEMYMLVLNDIIAIVE